MICYETPKPFGGVGAWYEDFSQVTDDEVRALLDQASLRRVMSTAVAVIHSDRTRAVEPLEQSANGL